MGTASPNVVDRLRQPEYVGENRCVPCTVVNVAIALACAAGIAVLSEPLGVGFLLVALVAIYLRGYLVPGTPTLTKRYFPDRVLAWFDKAPAEVDAPVAGSEGDLDPEPVLLEAGAVEFCKGGEDLCATGAFADEWRTEIERLRDDDATLRERLADLLDADAADVAVAERDSFAMVRHDGQAVARWESRAALLADAAAFHPLRDRVADWDELDLRDRGQLLNGARVFLEGCPECDAPIEFSEDTVESCCREVDVVAMGCTECDAVLLEVEA